jgi:hypothetical protein
MLGKLGVRKGTKCHISLMAFIFVLMFASKISVIHENKTERVYNWVDRYVVVRS